MYICRMGLEDTEREREREREIKRSGLVLLSFLFVVWV